MIDTSDYSLSSPYADSEQNVQLFLWSLIQCRYNTTPDGWYRLYSLRKLTPIHYNTAADAIYSSIINWIYCMDYCIDQYILSWIHPVFFSALLTDFLELKSFRKKAKTV